MVTLIVLAPHCVRSAARIAIRIARRTAEHEDCHGVRTVGRVVHPKFSTDFLNCADPIVADTSPVSPGTQLEKVGNLLVQFSDVP